MPSEPPPQPGAPAPAEGATTTTPPLPALTPPAPSLAAALLDGRLHPFTLLIAVANTVRSAALPLIALFALGNRPAFGIAFLLLLTVPSLLAALARYFTFTYRIAGGEMITRQGIFDRTERHIPLSRVQDVRLEQGVLHRLLRVVDVHIETASGKGAEASLSVLGQAEAERLRGAIFEQASSPPVPPGDAEAPAVPGGSAAAAPSYEIVRRVRLGELIAAGLTSNHLASGSAIVFGGWAFLDDLLPRDLEQRYLRTFVRTILDWWAQGGQSAWLVAAATLGFVVLAGMVVSVAGSVVLFYGFTLSRGGEDLHRAYGLFTRRASRLPRRRIQLLQIEESTPRRLFGLATLRADTAGSAAEGSKGGRDVLLPIVARAEVDALLPAFFPDVDAAPAAHDWRRVSPRAIRRGTAKGVLACAALAALSFLFLRSLPALWPLLLIAPVYGLNVLDYRHLGYALSPGYFRTRRGTFRRDTHVVPVRSVQVVTLRQSPFDRRHGLALLRVDTAGQTYTGGGPQIGNLPWHEALALARDLARGAAQARFRW